MGPKFLLGLIFLILIGAVGFYFFNQTNIQPSTLNLNPLPTQNQLQDDQTKQSAKVEVVAKNLQVPWALVFLPDQSIIVTERVGSVKKIKDGNTTNIAALSVKQIGEGGLHGVTIHSDFDKNGYMYFYYTYSEDGGNTLNKVVRFKLENDKLTEERVIVDQIPGATFHDGGRIKFGPDKNLYITTGDAQNPSLSQDRNSLGGKILRVTDEGNPAPGNPFNNHTYSSGHRNPQGIAWDSQGNLWEVEHGQSATDEINLIEYGKNYGWPEIRGGQAKAGMESPVLHSGLDTWAPGGATYYNGSIYFGGLRGQALFQYIIDTKQLKTHFKGELGRIREVVLGPDNMLYITTSNKDGRGNPKSDDDIILKINPELL